MPVVTGTSGNDTLVGTDEADQISGLAGNDVIRPGSGVDQVTGGEGDDTLVVTAVTTGWPAPPQTTFDGGAGFDTFNLSAITLFPQAFWSYDTANGSISVANYRMSAVERLIGSAGRDVFNFPQVPFNLEIHGGAGDDFLSSGGGSDRLYGGDGNDLISDQFGGTNYFYGGNGDDVFEGHAVVIDGGSGIDTYKAPYGNGLVIDLAESRFISVENVAVSGPSYYSVTARGTEGANEMVSTAWINGESSTVVFEGRGGDDVLTGAGAADTLSGGADNDRLAGGAGNDTLDGGDGDDLLAGGAGADVLTGGAGFDFADYSTAAAAVTARLDSMRATNDGDGGTDSFVGVEGIMGSAYNDLLVGGALGDTLKGGLGADTLLGQGGNDVLWGGEGALNQLQGGAGDDTYVLEVADSVVEAVGAGTDMVDARINAYNLAANVENLVFGGAGNFSGTGNALNNVMTGGAGDDLLRGRGGVDSLVGGSGMDTADYSQAAAGVNARLDVMRAVNDGDGATDTYTSIEAILGSAFNDTLVGGTLGDRLSGGLGADTLLGFAGNDILAGGQGLANQLQGGLGDDFYILDAYDSIVELAGQGHDVIEAHVGAHVMAANVEDMFYVGSNKFYGTGNAADNSITGGVGADILKGMGGSDRLFGGDGLDEVQVRGTKAQYTVTVEGAGWRIVDTVAGRDGTIYVESIETLRFMTGNTKTVLTYGAPAGAETASAKSFLDDAFVMPALADDHGPKILPELPGDLLASRETGGFESLLARFEANPFVVDGSHGFQLRMDDGHGHRDGDWLV